MHQGAAGIAQASSWRLPRYYQSLQERRCAMMFAHPIHPPRAGKVGGQLVTQETSEQALARAKGYPYARPCSSFIFVTGPKSSHPVAYTFNNAAWTPPSKWQGSLDSLLELQVSGPDGVSCSLGEVMTAAGVGSSVLTASTPLTAILAIGSNAGPSQLARKFPLELFPEGVVVPVIQCVLVGFDVVYAPLISSYGSATATLEASAGTEVSMFITYLTPPLQQRMHETEGAYNLVKLEDIQLLEGVSLEQHRCDTPPVAVQDSVYQYNHQCGTLHLAFEDTGDSPVALAEISAHCRRFPQLTQVQMQAALKHALQGVSLAHLEAASGAAPAADLSMLPSIKRFAGPSSNCSDSSSSSATLGGVTAAESAALDDWISSNLEQHTLRRARVAALTKAARPFQYDNADVLLVIGTQMSTSVK